MENYYHLSKKELSFISSIEEPIVSSILDCRLSRPVVIVYYHDKLLHVWSLKWFKYKVKHDLASYFHPYRLEIHSMY